MSLTSSHAIGVGVGAGVDVAAGVGVGAGVDVAVGVGVDPGVDVAVGVGAGVGVALATDGTSVAGSVAIAVGLGPSQAMELTTTAMKINSTGAVHTWVPAVMWFLSVAADEHAGHLELRLPEHGVSVAHDYAPDVRADV